MFSRRHALFAAAAAVAAPSVDAATDLNPAGPIWAPDVEPAGIDGFRNATERTQPRTRAITWRFFTERIGYRGGNKNRPQHHYFAYTDDSPPICVYLGHTCYYTEAASKNSTERSLVGLKFQGAKSDSAFVRRFRANSGRYSSDFPASDLPENLRAWREFFLPIATAEGDDFGTINTYDGVHLTFGPFQFAGHAQYLRRFLVRLAAPTQEASIYWPNWLPNKTESELTRDAIRAEMNADSYSLDADEATAAARLLLWISERPQLRRLQFEVMVQESRQLLRSVHDLVGGLMFEPPHMAWADAMFALDAMHHGRGGDTRMAGEYRKSLRSLRLARFDPKKKYANRLDAVAEKLLAQFDSSNFSQVASAATLRRMLA